MNNTIDTIKALARQYREEVIGWRRWMHRHPELSQQEFGTMAFVAERLSEMGLEPKTGIGKTGVMAMIRGGKDPDGYCVGLRADYDALPLTEATGLDFASENPGVMHACGHDMHTCSLLCAAKILSTLREELNGSIMLIFEPSEEMYPGGARMMMDDGLFDEVTPNEIYSFHCLPEMDYGHIGMKKGRYMASTDELYWTVKGKGCHTPHECRPHPDSLAHCGGFAADSEPQRCPHDAHGTQLRQVHRRRPHQHHPRRGEDGRHYPHIRPPMAP